MSEINAPDRHDRLGLYMTMGAAAIGIIVAIITTVARLSEVSRGFDIPVLIPLDGVQTMLPLGPNGAPFSATVATATVIVAEPAEATLFALWAQPIVVGLTWIGLLVIAALFCLRLVRAQVFTKPTARLLYVGAAILTAGWFLGSILTNMTTNGALSAISDYSYDSVTFSANLAPAIGVFALAAVGVAVQLGERLQKETAGLV